MSLKDLSHVIIAAGIKLKNADNPKDMWLALDQIADAYYQSIDLAVAQLTPIADLKIGDPVSTPNGYGVIVDMRLTPNSVEPAIRVKLDEDPEFCTQSVRVRNIQKYLA